MKPQNFRANIIFIFSVFLLCSFLSSAASARLLARKEGETGVKVVNGNITPAAGLFTDLEDLSNLMGLEECDGKDDECLNRRMIAEAHLDYIYTQKHNKP